MTPQMQPQQVPVDQKISVTLTAGMWSEIMNVLQTAPISWQRAHPLVQALSEQFGIATQQQETQPLPNGHDPVIPPMQ
jgi:hypothetical protein